MLKEIMPLREASIGSGHTRLLDNVFAGGRLLAIILMESSFEATMSCVYTGKPGRAG